MAFFMYKIIFRINYQTIIFKKKKKAKNGGGNLKERNSSM